MPPAAKKDCSIILFDLAAKPAAKQALIKICCNNAFATSKDLTKLILLNSATTDNRLSSHEGGCKHINEVSENVTGFDPQLLLRKIEQNGERGKANWLEGLTVALRNLDEEYAEVGGTVTYQILFLTDLSTPVKRDEKLIAKVVKGLKEFDTFLYVVGPEVEPPSTINDAKELKSWMEDLQVPSDNENLNILKEIISKSNNSVVCNYQMGVHLFFSYRKWGGTQPWAVPLALGSRIQIPAQTLKILNDDCPIQLTSSRGHFRQSIWVDAEDETLEVDASEVINGIKRHEKFVQMPDNKMFQVENPRGFDVLCFTDSTNVPEYFLRGEGCYCVLPDGTPEKREAFSLLVDCLAKQKKFAIARRVYNNNFIPKIVALIPKPDENPKRFLLLSLPYAEDVRANYKEKNAETAPQIQKNEEVYQFLDSLDVGRRPPLGVSMMESVNSQKIINTLADKIFGKHLKLEEIDISLLHSPTGNEFENLKKIWSERALKEETKRDKEDDQDSSDEYDW